MTDELWITVMVKKLNACDISNLNFYNCGRELEKYFSCCTADELLTEGVSLRSEEGYLYFTCSPRFKDQKARGLFREAIL